MKKSLALKRIASVGNKVASEAEDLVEDLYLDTSNFIKGVSKSFSKLDLEGVYSDARKSIRVAARRGNKYVKRAVRNFRRSNFYKSVSEYLVMVRKWSATQLKNIRKFFVVTLKKSRKMIKKSYPKVKSWVGDVSYDVQSLFSDKSKVKSFIKDNYPRIEKFVVDQLPAYRTAFSR